MEHQKKPNTMNVWVLGTWVCHLAARVRYGSRPWPLVGIRAYLFSVLCLGVSLAVRLALDPLWGDRLPYATFFLANLVVVQFVGIRPFVFTTLAGFLLSDWFFVPPRHSLLISDRVNQVNAALFFLISFALLFFSQYARKARVREQTAHDKLWQNVEELRESEARYSAVVRNSMDAILLTDTKGRILAANPQACHMFGRAEEELRTIGRMELVDSVDHQRVAHAEAEGETKGKVQLEATFVRSDGSKFTGEVSSGVFTDRNGLPRHSSIIRDVTNRKEAEARLQSLHRELVAASRQAGMAEIATNVLHNVGNVLNSVNVSATVVQNQVRQSRIATLGKVLVLLREHQSDLALFLTSDIKGKQLIPFLASTLEHLESERSKILGELSVLRESIEHINQIVAQQQSYAQMGGVLEPVTIPNVVEDALRLHPAASEGHSFKVLREYAEVPPIMANRHQLLQILVNLLQNARRACEQKGEKTGEITVRVQALEPKRVRIEVADNGIGIVPENLTKIFSHGFTTRKQGHGFGLHSGALAAQHMGGSLVAHSDGLGKGSSFVLELPMVQEPNGESANADTREDSGCKVDGEAGIG